MFVSSAPRRGNTGIEVVLVLLASLLIGFLVPAVRQMETTARKLDRVDDLKGIAMAMTKYRESAGASIAGASDLVLEAFEGAGVDAGEASMLSREFDQRRTELEQLRDDIAEALRAADGEQNRKLLREAEASVKKVLQGVEAAGEALDVLLRLLD